MNGRGRIWRIAAILGLAQLGFATVLPLLPLHLTENLGSSVKLVGVVVASFALVETFFKTAWGGVTDRLGRKPVIVTGLGLSAVAPLIMVVLRAPVLFVPLRLVDGLGSAALWPAAASAVADSTTPDRRATGMAVLNLAFMAGLAAGPALGLFVSGLIGDFRAGFFLASGLLASAMVLAVAVFPGDRTGRPPNGALVGYHSAGRPAGAQSTLAFLRTTRALTALYLVAFVQMFGVGLLVPIAAIFAKQRIGLSEHQIGVLFLVVVASTAAAMIPAGRLADRVGKPRLIVTGMAVGSLGMWVMSLSDRLVDVLAAGGLLGISYALSASAWLALITELAPPGRMGLAVGASETVQGLGLVLGPLLGGLLWDTIGPKAPFVASAIVMTIGAAVAAASLRSVPSARARG